MKTHSQLWKGYFLKKKQKFVHTYWHSRPQETETEKFTFPFGIHPKAHIHPLYSPAIKNQTGKKNPEAVFGVEFESKAGKKKVQF